MDNEIRIPGNNAKEAIIAIGQSLIERAEEITSDLNNVCSLTIYANITAGEVVTFDVTKNYLATLKETEKEE